MNIAYCLNIFYFKILGLKRVKRYVLIMISGNIIKQTFKIDNFFYGFILKKREIPFKILLRWNTRYPIEKIIIGDRISVAWQCP